MATTVAALDLSDVPELPKLDPSQVTVPFVVENAKAVAGIGMAVLAAGLLVMLLLSLLGNCGLSAEGPDDAYAPAAAGGVAVQVHTHKRNKVSAASSMRVCCD